MNYEKLVETIELVEAPLEEALGDSEFDDLIQQELAIAQKHLYNALETARSSLVVEKRKGF